MSANEGPDVSTVALTLLTLAAFASNSLLTRLALGLREIDAATFTTLRLGAGAAMLATVIRLRSGLWKVPRGGGVRGPLVLVAYAVPFSFAYVRISAATGALVLFGFVQLTMIGYGIARGQRPTRNEWAGLALALLGLISLSLPSATRPDPWGLLLMSAAGVAWGAYSILGRASRDSIVSNAQSFLWACPLVLLVNLVFWRSVEATPEGIALALLCGAVTSALGYVVWYMALRGLSVAQGAAVQLGVPVFAALGAVVFLNESLSPRLVVSGVAILGGLALVLAQLRRRPPSDMRGLRAQTSSTRSAP